MSTLFFNFYNCLPSSFSQPTREVVFHYRVLDKALINSPEEYSVTTSGEMKIGITSTLWNTWGMQRHVNSDNWIKILYEFAKRYVIQRIQEGGISKNEELLLTSHNAPSKCHYTPSHIPSRGNWEFDVENIGNIEEALNMLGIVSSLIMQCGQTIIVHKNWQQSNASSIEVRGLKRQDKGGNVIFRFDERNDIISGTVLQPKDSQDFWIVVDTEERIIDDIFDSFTAIVNKTIKKRILKNNPKIINIYNINNFEKVYGQQVGGENNTQVVTLNTGRKTGETIINLKGVPHNHLTFKLENQESYDYHDTYFFDTPTKFFDHRLSQAFPGIRGTQWFINPKEIIKRLKVLLRCPLDLNGKNNPIWWFRGYQSLQIEKCNFLSEEKFLMNSKECLIDKICVYKSSRYDRSFIYVELKAEDPVGIYQHDKDYIFRMIKNCGYANEEYGIYKEHLITREEFDDGAKFINNELINFGSEKVELRLRFLSRYNFIICAIFNPINSNNADEFFENYLNGMLDNVGNIEEVIEFVEKLPRHKNSYQ